MKLLKQIDALFRAGTALGLTDGELLERFIQRHEETAEAAFATLVERHGPMVLRVCRQVLRNEHDAEEAAQAAFLVLARRASSIRRRDSVASWLHGVALRVASKARVAAARRRTHERRGGEIMAERHSASADAGMIEGHERWDLLHAELRRLPEAFRSAVVLCDLEGSTQEQAAAQLQCPLGTVQSRLARGRAKLKARLQRRALDLSAFAYAGHAAQPVCSPPPAWAEATVNMAMRFAGGSAWELGGSASAALADEVLRVMMWTELKHAAAMALAGAVLISGVAVWATIDPKTSHPALPAKPAVAKAEPNGVAQQAPAQPESVTRTIRGTVRDEQGRPVAKAWIGSNVIRRGDGWSIVMPVDRIRERREPYRDAQGQVVPPGVLGKYFELHDENGNWQPIHPAAIRRFRKPDPASGSNDPSPTPFGEDLRAEAIAAVEKGQDVFELAQEGRWVMMEKPFPGEPRTERTDSDGRFLVDSTISTRFSETLHFASPDFLHQAVHVVRFGDPEKPVEITLRSTRLVRAKTTENPRHVPDGGLSWTVYSLDPAFAALHEIPAIGEKGARWAYGTQNSDANGKPDGERRLEARLPAGRYKVAFQSDAINQAVELVVPPGDQPLDLPDIHLETLAWVQTMGKPAPEIQAVDVENDPVKLADYRGKVIALAFWTSQNDAELHTVARLAQVTSRFKDQPVAILAVHDASLTSAEDLKKVLAPIRSRFPGASPIRFLLDKPLVDKARDADRRSRAAELGLGRTEATYQIWNPDAALLIDKTGRLVAATLGDALGSSSFAIDKNGALVRNWLEDDLNGDESEQNGYVESLIGSLEAALGLPSSRPAKPKPSVAAPKWPAFAKGKVIDRDGRPISGAKLSSFSDVKGERAVTTGPGGEFTHKLQKDDSLWPIRIEAAGFATRGFHFRLKAENDLEAANEAGVLIEPSGVIPEPLVLGPGVTVAGRVVRDGKPVAYASIGLSFAAHDDSPTLSGIAEIKTDARGTFRFLHILPETDVWAYSTAGSIENGGTITPQAVRTTEDGTTLDLGDLHVEKGRTLAGRLVTSDGKPLPAGTKLWASPEHAGGSLELEVSNTGRFEWKGLADGVVTLTLFVGAAQGGSNYRVSAQNKCWNPFLKNCLEGRLDHDITDLTILLEPDRGAARDTRSYSEVDPALVADFNDAKVGPITGVAPRP
jgi:RNA polymerase sigma-70 factor (ECF subfamily)